MVMMSAEFRKSLQDGLNAHFGMAYDEHPEEWRGCFEVKNSNKRYEEIQQRVGLGPASVKPEGAGVDFDEGADGWTARFVNETIALAFSITEELVEDELYTDVGSQYSKALARSMRHTKEVKGANIFNYAFDTNFAGGDGKPLLATDHPTYAGFEWSNKLTTPADLSETSLEQALIQIGQYKDDRGLLINAKAEALAIPVALQFVATRIMQSTQRPGVADNDINALKSRGMIPKGDYVNHYFTDDSAWFLKTDVPDGLIHFKRRAMQKGMQGDFESGNMRYRVRERYSFGWADPRGLFGSEGGGA